MVAHVLADGGTVAVMAVDVDGLKEINDRWGHVAGDALLTAVARRLRQRLREGDAIARIGGDEFLVICPGVDEAAAARLADMLNAAACQGPVEIGGQAIPVRLSIGWATAASTGEGQTIFERADTAMYAAKRRVRAADRDPQEVKAAAVEPEVQSGQLRSTSPAGGSPSSSAGG